MSLVFIKSGMIIDDNGELCELKVHLGTGVVVFEPEGDVKREVGHLLIDDPIEPATLSSIGNTLLTGGFEEGTRGVIITKRGIWYLTETEARLVDYSEKELLKTEIDLNYEFEPEDGDNEDDNLL